MKRLLLVALIALSLPAQVFAMSQPVIGPTGTGVINNATRFYPWGQGTQSTNSTAYTTAQSVMSIAGTFSNFEFSLSAAPGNVASSTTFTMMKNGIDTTVSCVIADTATSCSDADTITVAVGETVALKVIATANNAAADVFAGSAFAGSTDGEAFITGNTIILASSTATQYYPPYGNVATSTLLHASTTMPTAGIIDMLIATSSVTAGAAASGKSYDITVYKNGVAQALTCQIFEVAKTCTDSTHTIDYVAGDSIAIEWVPTNTPISTRGGWGLRFKPTINGESPLFDRLSSFSNVIRYEALAGTGKRSTLESGVAQPAPLAFDLKKVYFNNIYNGPTGVQTRTATARNNGAAAGAPGTLEATVGSSGWGSDTTNVASYALGDLMNFQMNVSGSPATSPTLYYLSSVAYVDPGTPPAAGYDDPGLIWFFDD
jgi:hypothetical protein